MMRKGNNIFSNDTVVVGLERAGIDQHDPNYRTSEHRLCKALLEDVRDILRGKTACSASQWWADYAWVLGINRATGRWSFELVCEYLGLATDIVRQHFLKIIPADLQRRMRKRFRRNENDYWKIQVEEILNAQVT